MTLSLLSTNQKKSMENLIIIRRRKNRSLFL